MAIIGTWGDLFPAVGLAKGLTDAGHRVRVAASPVYRELVEGEGLGFAPIGPPLGFADYAAHPKILSGRRGGFAGFLYLFRQFIFPNLDRYVADLTEAITGVDLLLAHPALIAAPIAAEATGVEWGTISVFPGLIPTAQTSPVPTRLPSPPGGVGRGVHRMAWKAARINMARLFDPPVNQTRHHLGLPATKDSFFAPVDSGGLYLVLASPAVVDRPPDWPQRVQLTGFVSWDHVSAWPVPQRLVEFLSGPDRPILVTLGASSSIDPQGFYEHAVEAVTQLGRRVLVLTGPTPTPDHGDQQRPPVRRAVRSTVRRGRWLSSGHPPRRRRDHRRAARSRCPPARGAARTRPAPNRGPRHQARRGAHAPLAKSKHTRTYAANSKPS